MTSVKIGDHVFVHAPNSEWHKTEGVITKVGEYDISMQITHGREKLGLQTRDIGYHVDLPHDNGMLFIPLSTSPQTSI